jgi:hypothetical protein
MDSSSLLSQAYSLHTSSSLVLDKLLAISAASLTRARSWPTQLHCSRE